MAVRKFFARLIFFPQIMVTGGTDNQQACQECNGELTVEVRSLRH